MALTALNIFSLSQNRSVFFRVINSGFSFLILGHIKFIAIGGSAGSYQLILKILASLPKDFPIPIMMTLHRSKEIRNGFAEALRLKSNVEVREPKDKEIIKPGRIYLAPSNYHLMVDLGFTFSLSTEEVVKFSRPSIDMSFESASYVYQNKLLGILLSGANSDGAEGIRKIKERGGKVIIQDPQEAMIKTMPEAAIKHIGSECVLNIESICSYLLSLKSV